MAAILEVEHLRLTFGGVKAVDGLDLQVHEHEIVSVIGPNGAGKTSAFNCVTGFYRPTAGTVRLGGEVITGMPPYAVAARGTARTFQNLRLFPDLTVLDNVRAGMHLKLRQRMFDTLLHTPRYHRSEEAATREAHRWLDFVALRGERRVPVRNLPYGEQRRVEIARALAREPRLLLLDEPGAGLNTAEKSELLALIRRIHELGIAIALIEHDMGLVMQASQRVVVLNFGKEIANGTPEQVKRDPEVIEAYLGREATHDEIERARESVAGSSEAGRADA